MVEVLNGLSPLTPAVNIPARKLYKSHLTASLSLIELLIDLFKDFRLKGSDFDGELVSDMEFVAGAWLRSYEKDGRSVEWALSVNPGCKYSSGTHIGRTLLSSLEKMKKEIHVEFIITIFALIIRLKPSQVAANNAILSGPHQRNVVCWRLIDKCNLSGTRNATKCDELGSLCFDRTKICVVMEEFCRDAISDKKRCDEGAKKCCENIVTQISSDL
uniref:GDNF domain-containing protein n=1 Tax=Ascaris lumbricoides TaxID=6252 RepID=A0A0M3IC15_ASCLU